MFRVLLFICVFLISFTRILPQASDGGTVSGFVYDAENGEALIGANAVLQGTGLGAGTNISGYFAIPGVLPGKYKLAVSFIGYKSYSEEVKVVKRDNKILKIYLKADALQSKEIVVSADSIPIGDKLFNKPISRVELNAAQINNIPRVIEADLLRSLQTLPGVQPLSDFSSALYIRGGTPDQNLYMIDGTDVYNPEHAFGLFSTFNTNAIKKVELSKGGFSSEYGGRLSSVLNVTNLDGNRNRFQGDVTISLISGATTLQAPLGSLGSISGSFRRTYIDQTYAKVVDEIPDYYFYDGNLKAFLDLNEKNKLVVSFYGGQDKLHFLFDKDASNSNGFDYDWGNMTGSINWKTIFSPNLFSSFWITGSRFFSNFDFNGFDFSETNDINDLTFKGSLEYYASKEFTVKFGFETKNLTGKFIEDFPGGKVDAVKTRNHFSGYVTTNWRPTPLWDIETGLRYDYFNSDKDYKDLDPRFSVKYRLNETSTLKFSTGIFHQYLNRIPRMFIASIWTTADQTIKGSSADHFILGYEKQLFESFEFEVEGYYKKYHNIYSFNPTFFTDIKADKYDVNNEPIYSSYASLYNRGDADSYGLEIMLRRDLGAVNGWIAYSYSRTENKVDGLNQGKSFVPRHDRTSTVNMVANLDIAKFFDELKGKSSDESSSKWLLSTNFVYSTGQPITLPASVYWAKAVPDWGDNATNIALYPSELNSYRLPPYIRMDVSLTYEKNYEKWSIAPYLQIFNIGNRKNIWFIDYDNKIKGNQVTQEIKPINMLPLLPSIGVNIKF